jgi:hypothetical protein
MISQEELQLLYIGKNKSMQEIALELGCSVHKVTYWMDKYAIKRRTISEAIYQRHNPTGDPFTIQSIKTMRQAELFGLGLGLYWGEGNKANQTSIRLGNTDPLLIEAFVRFLTELFGVSKDNLKFGLQIFSDIDQDEALNFWIKKLSVRPSQFYKITVTISGSLGTYRKKNRYGVVTVYFHNKKLRDILVNMLPS